MKSYQKLSTNYYSIMKIQDGLVRVMAGIINSPLGETIPNSRYAGISTEENYFGGVVDVVLETELGSLPIRPQDLWTYTSRRGSRVRVPTLHTFPLT